LDCGLYQPETRSLSIPFISLSREIIPMAKPAETNRKRASVDRRTILKTAAAVPFIPWTRPAFANIAKNDRPLVGCIGMGGMGRGDAKQHTEYADIVAVCDVDSNLVDRAFKDPEIGREKADKYEDYRRVLERDDIDVISISTTDHWHVKIAIEALQAGKHVFCQKPLTLTLEENQLIRAACEKYNQQIFTVGTQQRSDHRKFLRAVNMVSKGLLGDIKKVTVGIEGGKTGGPFKVEEAPSHLNWDMWLGSAQKVDYRRNRCHNNFRWWYEYSGGKFTDWGAHHVDIASWATGKLGPGQGPVTIDGTDAKHPVKFKDGYPVADDSYNTSTDFSVKCTFADGLLMDVTSRGDNGILFEGTKGRIFVNRRRIDGKPIKEGWDKDHWSDEDLVELYKGKPHEHHKQNFYRCIAEGGQPVSDVASHTQVMNTCLLAVIAARLNRVINWDPKAEKITGDEQAASFFAREARAGFEMPKV